MAVDWFLVGIRALNVVEVLQLVAIVGCVVAIVVGMVVDWWQHRPTAEILHFPHQHASNVVQRVPRARPYDWAEHGDAS